jgi:uncharacterized protein (DUF58 family)
LQRSWGVFLLWIAALIFALASGRELAFNLLYFITGVIGVSFIWAWLNQRGLLLRRATRMQRSQVGKYFEETLELANRSRWPKLWVEVHDFSDLPAHQVSRVVNSLGRHSTSRWQVRTLCKRRGRYALGPITLTSGDPLGIFRFTRELPESGTLVVSPATIPIPEFSPPTGYLPGGEAVHRRTPYVTSSVSGIRDYVPGDSFNRIHWPSTARTGRLVSKEFELDPLADVWMFLDMYDDAHAEAPWVEEDEDIALPWLTRKAAERMDLPPSTVEYSVTVAASLAHHFLEADREVGFLSYAEKREIVQPDRGERQLSRLLEVLAVIQAHGHLPIAEALAIDGATLARHTTLIVITPSTDSRWVTVLRGLRSRGVHGIAVLLAARTFGPAPEWAPTLAALQAAGLPAYVVQNGDDIPSALAHIASGAGRSVAFHR